MIAMDDSAPIREQLDYYRARAVEYDQWWLRQGRYNRGTTLNARWFAEAAQVSAALSAFRPAGRVLELACGTGIWSEQLLPFASHLTAVDGSPEMLAINAARLRSPGVRYVEANLFEWQPTDRFDTVFFGFWLSHVPPERFADFWSLVGSCLSPGGRSVAPPGARSAFLPAAACSLSTPVTRKAQRPLTIGCRSRRRRFSDDASTTGESFRFTRFSTTPKTSPIG